jgi:hypothetical protein
MAFASGASAAEVEAALAAREGGAPSDAQDIALAVGPARKLSFGSAANDTAVTYYLFGEAPVVGLRIKGPGNLALDEAAGVMLKSFRRK